MELSVHPIASGGHLPDDGRHIALSFMTAPDTTLAAALLDRITTGFCAFTKRTLDRPLVLYGAGNLGSLARDYLRLCGIEFAMVVDLNAGALKADPAWEGVAMCHPNDVRASLKADSLLAVTIATTPYVPLEKSLEADGWKHIVPFYDLAESYRDRHPLSNGWFAPPIEKTDSDKIRTVLARWDDDMSRAHHLQFIAWRRLREEWSFDNASVPHCARFFIPEIVSLLTDRETFIDAGAHHGSVTRAFVEQTDGRFAAVLAIEPDTESFRCLAQTVENFPVEIAGRISIESKALDAVDGTRRFHSGLGYASQFAETGQEFIRTTTIDALGIAPTFLKLHLEGGEYDALRGGLQTIRTHRPIVAFTTYHNDDGLWKTPLFLMDALQDYRFIMRLHSWCGTGAVVYAIPRERMQCQ